MTENNFTEDFIKFSSIVQEMNSKPEMVSKILRENNIDESILGTEAATLAKGIIRQSGEICEVSNTMHANYIGEEEISQLIRVEALLVSNFAVSPPTIVELSRISEISPTKLKNHFKALYGLSIYKYYQKNRMLKAKSLLMERIYTKTEVAQMIGYKSCSHFIIAFRKEFGFLPDEVPIAEMKTPQPQLNLHKSSGVINRKTSIN